MRIAVVSALYELLPPSMYGGIERVVYYIVEGLVKKGHDVTVFAPKGSSVSAKLYPIIPTSLREMAPSYSHNYLSAYYYEAMSKVADQITKEKFDVVHNHSVRKFLPFIRFLSTPVLTTAHIPWNDETFAYLFKEASKLPHVYFSSLSLIQQNKLPNIRWIGNVYNGIDMAKTVFREIVDETEPMIFISRASPEKGVDTAITLSKILQRKLTLVTKVDSIDQPYFQNNIQPHIDGNITHIGEVDEEQKYSLLSNSRLFLFPLRWEEAFGLVLIEAMACGTPVIAYEKGSIPEIVKDGETGFLVNPSDDDVRGDWVIKKSGEEGLKEAVEKIYTMPADQYALMRKACRERVEKNFTIEKMVEEYDIILQRIII